MTRPILNFAVALLMTCIIAQPTYAGVVHKTAFDLANESDLIVVGDVVELESYWNDDHTRIMTRVVVRVSDRLIGESDDELTLHIVGGTIGELTLATSVTPRFELDDHVLLFLQGEDYEFTGEYQGAYLTDGVEAMRMDSGVSKRFEPAARIDLNELLQLLSKSLPGEPQFTLRPYTGTFSLDALNSFVLLGRDWTWQANPMGESYKINANCADAGAGSAAQQINAINSGALVWNNAGAKFTFSYGGTTTSTADAYDDQNIIFFKNTSGMNSSTIAVCHSWFIGTDIVEWDIIFNDFHHNFWNGAGGCSSQKDIQSVAAHELGHALGLDHSATSAATMFATTSNCNIEPRSLHADDIAGVQAIYGVTGLLWVDFLYVGPSDGSNSMPYSTLQAGINAAISGGILRIKPGTSSEIFPSGISKILTLEAASGTVIIGQ